MSQSQETTQIFVTTAVHSWNQTFSRADKTFASISDDEMLREIAPGKNRIVYIFGHLVAVNDAMLPQLRIGTSLYPHLRSIFIEQADRAAEQPHIAELRTAWAAIHQKISAAISEFTPEQWLERHATVAAEDFIREPHRNRLAILLNRAGHLSYHLGQVVPVIKR